ncbi:MAG: tetratricopeptide repeat protein, partial [Phycisphaerales bacterium]
MSDWMDAESHADRAFEMYERGMWAEAESELRKALSLNPHQADWHFNLGLTLEAAGRDFDALASYERAIGLADEFPEPLIAAAVVAMRVGRVESAVDWLRRAIELDGTIEAAHAHLIEAQVRLGQHEEAETSFYIAQYALPEPSALCYAAVAEALLQREQYERGGWCLREAMRINPTLPRLRARLGNVYAALGDSRRALHLYLRDLRDDPGNVDTLLDYGELLMEFNRHGEAAEKFRRVLELEPANVDAHFRLGQIASRTKRFERAMVEFELVLKLDPNYPRIRLALAEVLIARG